MRINEMDWIKLHRPYQSFYRGEVVEVLDDGRVSAHLFRMSGEYYENSSGRIAVDFAPQEFSKILMSDRESLRN